MAMFTKGEFLAMRFDVMPGATEAMRRDARPYTLNAAYVRTQTRHPEGTEEFTGVAGDAAQDKSEVVAGSLNRFAGEVDNSAGVVDGAHEGLWPAAWNLRASINAAEGPVVVGDGGRLTQIPGVSFHVTEDWKVELLGAASLTGEQNDALNAWLAGAQEGLDRNREALEQASDYWAGQFRADVRFDQVANDPANPLVGETPEQAQTDVRAYLAGTADGWCHSVVATLLVSESGGRYGAEVVDGCGAGGDRAGRG